MHAASLWVGRRCSCAAELSGRPSGCRAAEALSVGTAAWSAPALRTVEIDRAIAALRAQTEHGDGLVRARIQLINRLHVLLVKLVPTGLARGLSAESAAEALHRVRSRDTLGTNVAHTRGRAVAELRRLGHASPTPHADRQ